MENKTITKRLNESINFYERQIKHYYGCIERNNKRQMELAVKWNNNTMTAIEFEESERIEKDNERLGSLITERTFLLEELKYVKGAK